MFFVVSSGVAVEPVVILGGGVGAMTSALYLARGGMEPLVLEGRDPGGLLMQSSSVQNWPGELNISGSDLVAKLRKQAEANGIHFQKDEVVAVDLSHRPFTVRVRPVGGEKEKEIQAASLIIAMGSRPNRLGVPGEATYWGRGVSCCAICDGSLYRDKIVGVVGGGDAAVSEGLYLASLAKQVHLFVRKAAFRGVEGKLKRELLAKPNVQIHFETEVEEIVGDEESIQSVRVKEKGEISTIPMEGIFLAIGARPNSEIFSGKLKLDANGYITLVNGQETSIANVFAVGDIADPLYKQAITAAGDGAKAALQLLPRLSQLTLTSTPVAAAEPLGEKGLIEIQTREELNVYLRKGKPVVVDFYAPWCPPCRQIAPSIESAAVAHRGKIYFLKVNVDSSKELSRDFKIRSMPTVLYFDEKGALTDRRVGGEEIQAFLRGLDAR